MRHGPSEPAFGSRKLFRGESGRAPLCQSLALASTPNFMARSTFSQESALCGVARDPLCVCIHARVRTVPPPPPTSAQHVPVQPPGEVHLLPQRVRGRGHADSGAAALHGALQFLAQVRSGAGLHRVRALRGLRGRCPAFRASRHMHPTMSSHTGSHHSGSRAPVRLCACMCVCACVCAGAQRSPLRLAQVGHVAQCRRVSGVQTRA